MFVHLNLSGHRGPRKQLAAGRLAEAQGSSVETRPERRCTPLVPLPRSL